MNQFDEVPEEGVIVDVSEALIPRNDLFEK
jgi:hypothetical protein